MPFALAFDRNGELNDVKGLRYLAWFVDVSWSFDICLKFFIADEHHRAFKVIARNYLKGWFIFDFLATVPPMIFLEQNFYINCLKLLRFCHLGQIYAPFRRILRRLFPNDIQKQIEVKYSILSLFISFCLFGHVMACAWIIIASWSEDSFINSLQASDERWVLYGVYEIYVFSLYWVLTTITTVGFGDYTGINEREWLFSILLEFFGLIIFSTTTALITPLFSFGGDFNSYLSEKKMDLDFWIMKLQRANDPKGNTFMRKGLYRQIEGYILDAFTYDHNSIVEDFDFYQRLTPKDQTNLINLIFADFRMNFRSFFDPCDQGFINEAIIWLFTRRYSKDNISRTIVPPGHKMQQMYFIMEGGFGLYNKV